MGTATKTMTWSWSQGPLRDGDSKHSYENRTPRLAAGLINLHLLQLQVKLENALSKPDEFSVRQIDAMHFAVGHLPQVVWRRRRWWEFWWGAGEDGRWEVRR